MKHIMPFLVFFLLLSACGGNSPALTDVATTTATPPPSPTDTEPAKQSLPSATEPSPTPQPTGSLYFDPTRFQVVSIPLKPDTLEPYAAGGLPQIPSLTPNLVFNPTGNHFAVTLPWYWNAATDARLCVNPSEQLADGSYGAYTGPSFSLWLYDLFNWAHNAPLQMDATAEDATKYCTSITANSFGSPNGPFSWNKDYGEVGIGYSGPGGNLIEAIILDFNGANVGGGSGGNGGGGGSGGGPGGGDTGGCNDGSPCP
jgi:hypothetical protein